MLNFKGIRFPIDVILVCIRWYAAYPLSYRHLEEMMEERGVSVDHSSINRWAIRFLPLIEKIARKHMPAVKNWLRHADAARMINESYAHITEQSRVDGMVRANVVAQLNNIRTHPSVALAMSQNKLRLHGWVYDIETGLLTTLDQSTGNFVSLEESIDL